MSQLFSSSTKSLQERFPEVYKEFFVNSNIVISIQNVDKLFGFSAGWIGGPGLHKKIATKTYVGIRLLNSKNDIKFNKYYFYDCLEDQFATTSQFYAHNEIRKIILGEIKKINKNKDFVSLEINVLTEKYEDTVLINNYIVPLAMAIYYQFGMIQIKENLHTDDLAKINKKILGFSCRMNRALRGRDLYINTLIALATGKSPVVVFEDNKEKKLSQGLKHGGNPLFVSYKLNELFPKVNVENDLPLDICNIIFSLNDSKIYVYEHAATHIKDNCAKISNYYLGLMNNIKNEFDKSESFPPDFLARKDIKENFFWTDLLRANSFQAFNSIYCLAQLYSDRLNEEKLKNFTASVRKMEAAGESIAELSHERLLAMKFFEDKLFEKFHKFDFAFYTYGWEKNGMYIFTPKGKYCDVIKQAVQEIKKEYFPGAAMYYCSWEDGEPEDSVKLEQDLEQKVYSKFISKGSVFVREFSQATGGTLKAVALDKLDKIKSDILIDLENREICIAGNKLTSRDIHSSTVTSEILRIMLNNQGKKISNKDLPESSYTSERGELQSKIVSPLIKVVKKYAKKNLKLKITGSLMDFWVELNLDGLKIVVVEKTI